MVCLQDPMSIVHHQITPISIIRNNLTRHVHGLTNKIHKIQKYNTCINYTIFHGKVYFPDPEKISETNN